MLSVLGLFSGIGGFELGFRRAGFDIAGVCEIEPYCQAVLRKHFPEARLYTDVKELTIERLTRDGIRPDIITGGFPCQDISLAGKGAGLEGERSGLWFEMHRVIAETRPRWVVAENVAALRSRGLDQVLGSLAAIGYDAEWHCIPASAVGAPHRRDRIWIVAYPSELHGHGCGVRARSGGEMLGRVAESGDSGAAPALLAYPQGGAAGSAVDLRTGQPEPRDGRGNVAYPARLQPGWAQQRPLGQRTGQGGQPQPVADADATQRGSFDSARGRMEGQHPVPQGQEATDRLGASSEAVLGHPHQPRLEIRLDGHARKLSAAERAGWWLSEPDVGRVAHGVPARVGRLRALGNAVVPQIPEIIADAIAMAELTA